MFFLFANHCGLSFVNLMVYFTGREVFTTCGMGGDFWDGNLPKKHGHMCIASCRIRYTWDFSRRFPFVLIGLTRTKTCLTVYTKNQDFGPAHVGEENGVVMQACAHARIVQ